MIPIPEHTELEIDSVIARQNVAKEGHTTFYVDGATGNDAANFLRWETAAKTIQAAVDKAESWAKIYIKAGTYAENVVIDGKDWIRLIGTEKSTTIISVATGDALTIKNNINFRLENFTLVAPEATKDALVLDNAKYASIYQCDLSDGVFFRTSSDYAIFENVIVDGNDQQGICIQYSNFCTILNSEIKNNVHNGIFITLCNDLLIDSCDIHNNAGNGIYYPPNIDSYDNEIKNCDIYAHTTAGCFNLVCRTATAHRLKLHDNNFTVKGASDGNVQIEATCSYCNIYHNNFIDGIAVNVQDAGSNNTWHENYYSEYITDINNDGLCDTPYAFTVGVDYAPVSKRNGWNQVSLGIIGDISYGAATPSGPQIDEWWTAAAIDVALWTTATNGAGAVNNPAAEATGMRYVKLDAGVVAGDYGVLSGDTVYRVMPTTVNGFNTRMIPRAIILEWEAKLSLGGGIAGFDNTTCIMGFTEEQAENRSNDDCLGFVIGDAATAHSNEMYVLTDDNINETETAIKTYIGATGSLGDYDEWHKYRIYIYDGSVKFYVDGTSVATHTTNLPDMDGYIQFWCEEAGGGPDAEIRLGAIRCYYL